MAYRNQCYVFVCKDGTTFEKDLEVMPRQMEIFSSPKLPEGALRCVGKDHLPKVPFVMRKTIFELKSWCCPGVPTRWLYVEK